MVSTGRSRVAAVVAAAVVAGAGVVALHGGTGGVPASGGSGGTWPNTTAANVFISPTGNDSGANCSRFSTPTGTPPSAATVCLTANKAYTLASAGDTVWVLPGSYTTGNPLGFTAGAGTAPTSKSVSDDTNCNLTHQCVYFTPQPGQAANVVTNEIDWKGDQAPAHMYYKGFIRGACPSFSNISGLTTGSNDITADGFVNEISSGLHGGSDPDCVPYMYGPNHYSRIINGTFEHYCIEGSTGGMQIQANTGDGETTDHLFAPDHFLIANNDFSQVNTNCVTQHQDCIHLYSAINSTFDGNSFRNCVDSSILAGAIDEVGFNENDVVQNNWFGPTQYGVNNCCLRGDNNAPATETFDGWTIRFNSSTSTWMNKNGNVLNNVNFIGNIGLGTNLCVTGGTYAYNISGSAACDATDSGNQTNTTVKWADQTGTLAFDLHIGAGSIADGFVPGAQANGCSAVALDYDKAARGSPCDAGADER